MEDEFVKVMPKVDLLLLQACVPRTQKWHAWHFCYLQNLSIYLPNFPETQS